MASPPSESCDLNPKDYYLTEDFPRDTALCSNITQFLICSGCYKRKMKCLQVNRTDS